MENTLRIIITVFFVGLIALAIIFFGVFGIAPLGQVGKEKKVKAPAEEIVIEEGGASQGEASENGQTTNIPPKEREEEPESQEEKDVPVIPPPQPKRQTRLDVPPGSPDAPQQSAPVSRTNLPVGSVEIIARDGKLTPEAFAVREGDEITLAFTSGDKRTHILAFEGETLMAVAIGVGPDETRTMKFKVPKTGIYTFYCSVPGHAGVGEKGSMTVIK